MRLTAVVVTWVGGTLPVACLDALAPQLEPDDELVLVVTRPGAPPVPRAVRVVHTSDASSYAEGVHRGLEGARGAGYLILNDDTRPLPGFVSAVRAGLDQGFVQPRILLDDGSGRLDNAGHRLFGDGFNVGHGRGRPDGPAFDEPGTVGALSGAAFGAPAGAWRALGGFDLTLGPFGEDLDLSLRAVRAGHRLVYAPHARIHHTLGASYGRHGAWKCWQVERNRVRAALRSLPVDHLATLPIRSAGRLVATAAAAALGGQASPVPLAGRVAALAGGVAGWAWAPQALGRRWADSAGWVLDDAAMRAHLRAHTARWEDLL